MKKHLFFLFLSVLFFSLPVQAKKNKYDRGIVMKTFIPKGQWMVGTTFSYSEHVDDNFEFLSVLKNISIGGRFAYGRTVTNLNNLSLELGDDLSFDVSDYESTSNTFTTAVFLRTYLNLGDSKRFGLFNEARVSYGYSESNGSSGTGVDLSGLYQLKHNLNIGVAPGITVFVNDFAAVEASISVAGLNFNWYDQTRDQVYKGKRTSSSANFKINLLSVDLGIVFYL